MRLRVVLLHICVTSCLLGAVAAGLRLRSSLVLVVAAVSLILSNYAFFLFQIPRRYRQTYTVLYILVLTLLELATSSKVNPFRY